MVITYNCIIGHLVNRNYIATFTFLVGFASGDYTPAQISSSTANSIYVSVQDDIASVANAGDVSGMQRIWNIYANYSGTGSAIKLQHNMATN